MTPNPAAARAAAEVQRLQAMQPAQIVARFQELQKNDPELLKVLAPRASALVGELSKINPTLLDQVRVLAGL